MTSDPELGTSRTFLFIFHIGYLGANVPCKPNRCIHVAGSYIGAMEGLSDLRSNVMHFMVFSIWLSDVTFVVKLLI